MKRLAIALLLLSISAYADDKPKRNPFQYVTRPSAPPKIAPKPAPVVEVPAPVFAAEPEVPRRPDPPAFPYRFIGMFGHPDRPIVAFVTDDRVVTVQLGAEIDGQFILRHFGLESVDIGFVNDERTVRIQMGR